MKTGRIAVILGLLLTSLSSRAAILSVSPDGRLSGATGVDVQGVLYDVSFVDGTCIEVFSGCDQEEDFVFRLPWTALGASIALSQQVFIDDPALGNFDAIPGLTLGCGLDEFLCDVLTPFQVGQFGLVEASVYANLIGPEDSLSSMAEYSDSTLSPLPQRADRDVWAVWSIAPTSVPEPGSLALLGVGLIAAVIGRRKKRATQC